MKLVLAISFVLMGLKFLAYYLTNSNAILTDAIESIVNILAGSFAYIVCTMPLNQRMKIILMVMVK